MGEKSEPLYISYSKGHLLNLVLAVTLSCFITGFNIGSTNSSLGNISSALNWPYDNHSFSSLCNGIFSGGGIVGSGISGKLANKYGRRVGMMIIDLICIFACILVTFIQTCIPTIPTFITGRFISGIAAGMGVSIPPLYINETVPEQVRGKLGSLVQFQVTFGIFVAFTLCIMLPVYNFDIWENKLWYLIYGFLIIPATIQLLLLKFVYVYDTPKWLLNSHKVKELEVVLRTIYAENWEECLNKIEQESKPKKMETEEAARSQEPSFAEMFCNKRHRKPLIIGCTLSMLQQLSGINMFIFYSTSVYIEIVGNSNYAASFTAALGFFNMLSTMLCLLFIEKYGRKILLLQGSIGMGVAHLTLFLFNICDLPPAASLPIMMVYIGFFESSIGPVLWIYCGDILTDRGIGIAVAVNWIFTVVITAVFEYYVAIVGIGFAFLTFSIICFGTFLFVWIFIKETKGISRESIKILMQG